MVTHNPSSKINLSDIQFAILTTAGKIITRSGISGLTIGALAKEMRTSETAIYQHYLTREDIIVSMLDYLTYDMDKRYTNTVNDTSDTEAMFVRLFRNQATFFIENPYFMTLVFSDGLLEECERVNTLISKIMDIKISHLLPIIVSGQENGLFRNDLSPEELAHIVMGTFRLLMYKWRISNFKINLKHRNERTIESILRLIKV